LCWYEDGDEKYISIEGVPYQKPNAQSRIYHKDGSGIPNLSVGAQQSSLGDVLGRAFEPLALPSTKVTLSLLQELQHIEIALQNKLNQDPHRASVHRLKFGQKFEEEQNGRSHSQGKDYDLDDEYCDAHLKGI
jgi:hypothetical protein